MLEPRLLGLMPDPTRGEELLAANAEKPLLLAPAEEPEEEGTEPKGEDLELKDEKVGCVRAGASWAGFESCVSAADFSAEAESFLTVSDVAAVSGAVAAGRSC